MLKSLHIGPGPAMEFRPDNVYGVKNLLFGVAGSRCCWGCGRRMLEVIRSEVGEEVFLISQTTVRPDVTDGEGTERPDGEGDTGYEGCERIALGRGEGWSGKVEAGAVCPAPPKDMGLSWRHLTVT